MYCSSCMHKLRSKSLFDVSKGAILFFSSHPDFRCRRVLQRVPLLGSIGRPRTHSWTDRHTCPTYRSRTHHRILAETWCNRHSSYHERCTGHQIHSLRSTHLAAMKGNRTPRIHCILGRIHFRCNNHYPWPP